jgi:hypothetical protein
VVTFLYDALLSFFADTGALLSDFGSVALVSLDSVVFTSVFVGVDEVELLDLSVAALLL